MTLQDEKGEVGKNERDARVVAHDVEADVLAPEREQVVAHPVGRHEEREVVGAHGRVAERGELARGHCGACGAPALPRWSRARRALLAPAARR